MANVIINDAHLNDIAAAIRAKNGSTDTYKPSEMAAAISAIEGSSDIGGTVSFDDYISRSLTGSIQVSCPTIGDYGLYGNKNMTSLTSTATALGTCACGDNVKLATATLPNATSIGAQCFANCQKMTSIEIPNCTSIGDYCFGGCYMLQSLTIPKVTSIGDSAFVNCYALTKIDMTDIETIGYEALFAPYIGPENLEIIIIRRTDDIPSSIKTGVELGPQFLASYVESEDSVKKGYIYVPAAMIQAYQSLPANDKTSELYHWELMSYRAIEDYPEICG